MKQQKRATSTTTPGTVNPNQQEVVRDSGAINAHRQRVIILRCLSCNHEYGAQGCDAFLRKCPQCKGGAAGEGG